MWDMRAGHEDGVLHFARVSHFRLRPDGRRRPDVAVRADLRARADDRRALDVLAPPDPRARPAEALAHHGPASVHVALPRSLKRPEERARRAQAVPRATDVTPF